MKPLQTKKSLDGLKSGLIAVLSMALGMLIQSLWLSDNTVMTDEHEQTIMHLREDVSDCHTALDVRGQQVMFLLPPVSDEAIIAAWRGHLNEKRSPRLRQDSRRRIAR